MLTEHCRICDERRANVLRRQRPGLANNPCTDHFVSCTTVAVVSSLSRAAGSIVNCGFRAGDVRFPARIIAVAAAEHIRIRLGG